MIKTYWFNLKPLDGGPAIVLTIGDAGGSGLLKQVIDLGEVFNRGEMAGIEIEVLTGVVAPGATKNLTVNYAFCSKDNRTVAQLLTAAAQQACVLPNAAATIRDYLLPLNYMGAQFLHVWFDCDALDAGAVITIELRINAKTAN